MRRTYISPEYQNRAVYGTLNMVEESTFFSAKMLEVEDSISIDNQDIIYYQKLNGEQLDFSIESSLSSIVYSPGSKDIGDKFKNHTLVIDTTQPKFQLDNNTRWILTIDLKTIITNYLFATLKKYRTFEGVKNEMTMFNDVNVGIRNYIQSNVLNRYKYKGVELYVRYQDLRNQSLFRYDNTWSTNIIDPVYKVIKIQSETEFDQSSIKITFNQEKPSSSYKFEYYFNILFEKI
jgi:hypothetical protein